MSAPTAIHPSAVVDPGAVLGEGVRIGPFAYVGPEVEIGDGTVIGPHCAITGPTRIGRDNHFVGHAAIGGDPQDKKYKGERVELVVGDRNQVREFVTVNRGTGAGGGITRIGSDNMLLAYTHVAHDCIVGNHCVFSNNSTLAGHVTIEDWVIMSGFAGVHQFCRVGAHAFIGMGVLLSGDVPPFTMVAGDAVGRPRGINSEGLKRRGFSSEGISAIKRAYKTLYRNGLTLDEARQQIAAVAADVPELRQFSDFIADSGRGIVR